MVSLIHETLWDGSVCVVDIYDVTNCHSRLVESIDKGFIETPTTDLSRKRGICVIYFLIPLGWQLLTQSYKMSICKLQFSSKKSENLDALLCLALCTSKFLSRLEIHLIRRLFYSTNFIKTDNKKNRLYELSNAHETVL